MIGLVYKSTGSWYSIKDEQGQMWNARLKGVIKLDHITSTNPIAVGDKVTFEMENEGEASVMITAIEERTNYITRQSPKGKHQKHIVAANLDQSMLVATIRDPKTSRGFIDRFLVACEMYHVPAILIFNKTDLYKDKERKQLAFFTEIYSTIGYKVGAISVRLNEGVDEVKEMLQGKTTLISGHSGVGKSTFINLIVPGSELRTKDVSGWSGKGMHTTTFAEMFDLSTGGFIKGSKIIDTPGLREFGLVEVEKQELSGYFPEMRKLLNDCQFNNCLHTDEPGCAIKDAVAAGKIDEGRYVSYYNILESITKNNW